MQSLIILETKRLKAVSYRDEEEEMLGECILRIEHLNVYLKSVKKGLFHREETQKIKIEDVSFQLNKGERLGITGSSGSGKSLLVKTILGMLNAEDWIITCKGEFLDKGSLFEIDDEQRRQILKSNISYIPQDAINALNPYIPVLKQIKDEVAFVRGLDEDECEREAIYWLNRLGIKGDMREYNKLPREFSGGMRQRAVFAMAMVRKPQLIIADEPSSAMDVVNQMNTVELLDEISKDGDKALLYISHSPAMIQKVCNKIAIMQEGKIAEIGDTNIFFKKPQSLSGREMLNGVKELSTYDK